MTAVRSEPVTARRRSLLFVPAHVDRFVAKAASAGPDAVVLDLEDSVPASEIGAALDGLAANVARLDGVPTVCVRVNSGPGLERDLGACRDAGVAEVVVPKVETAADVQRVRQVCRDLGFDPRTGLLVESARGIAHVKEILAAGPAASVALGAEDLRAELELHAPTTRTSEVLMHAHVTLILAALSAGVAPLGLLGSIANYGDAAETERAAVASWRLGYRGSYCIHPDQVAAMNRGFRPADEDIAWARRVSDAQSLAEAQGRGAFVVDGAMVDAPLVERARRILQLA